MKSFIHSKQFYWIIVSIIFIWGMALRAPEILTGNFLFGHDHGRDYLAAYNIVENHKMTLIGAEAGSGVAGINGIFHGPGYFYLMSLAYLLFQGNPFGGQLFMFIFGIVAMALIAYVGLRMMGKVGLVISLFFVSVSPLIVSQSRFIWSSHPITPFVILALYFVYRIPDNPKIFAPLSIFIAACTYHSQLGVAIPLMIPIFLSLPFIYHVRDIRTYLYSFGASILAFLPMILFDIRHGFMATKSALSYISTGGGTGVKVPLLDPIRLSNHAFDYWNNFYNTFTFEFGWIPWKMQMNALFFVIPIICIGLFLVRDAKLRKFIFHIIMMIVFTCAAYLLLNNVVWDYYLTHLRIGYIFLFSFAGYGLIDRILRSQKKPWIYIGLGSIYMLFVGVVFVGSLYRMNITYAVDFREQPTYYKILGKKAAIDMIYKDAAGKPFNVMIYIMSVYTHPYDYLFLTYGRQKYGFVPKKEKKGLTYLIIEPDTEKAWRVNGWLETVVQGGTSIWKKTIVNGLIIEKRIYPE